MVKQMMHIQGHTVPRELLIPALLYCQHPANNRLVYYTIFVSLQSKLPNANHIVVCCCVCPAGNLCYTQQQSALSLP